MARNIEGKVVVITGASRGLGESTARLLAANGAKVALGARRKDRIDALVKDITAKGGSALGFKTDVTKRGDVATELTESSSEEATRENLREFYKMAIPADS